MGKPQFSLMANPKANTSLTLGSLEFRRHDCNAQRALHLRCVSIHNDRENAVAWPIALGLAGVGLGLTWNVLVLVPVSVGLLIVFGIIALTNGVSVYETFSAIVLPIISVQAGYMCGLRGRDFMRAHARKGTSTKTERI